MPSLLPFDGAECSRTHGFLPRVQGKRLTGFTQRLGGAALVQPYRTFNTIGVGCIPAVTCSTETRILILRCIVKWRPAQISVYKMLLFHSLSQPVENHTGSQGYHLHRLPTSRIMSSHYIDLISVGTEHDSY
jgi:hypothetical protein